MLLMEQIHLIPVVKPQTAAAARSGDWVDVSGYKGLLLVVFAGQNGAGTFNITVDKAKTAAGGSNSDGITVNHVYSMEDFTPGTSTDAWVAVTAAATFPSSNTGSLASMYALDIPVSEIGEGYDFVQLELSTGGQAANFICAIGILYGGLEAAAANQIAALKH